MFCVLFYNIHYDLRFNGQVFGVLSRVNHEVSAYVCSLFFLLLPLVTYVI